MFPHCLIDYLNDEEGFIREATQLEEEALSTIRNNLQNPDLNAECYSFSLRPITSDISGFLDVFIYIGKSFKLYWRKTMHAKMIQNVSNSRSVHNAKFYSFVANAINNNHSIYVNSISNNVSEEEAHFIEYCAILFAFESSLLANADHGYTPNLITLSKDQMRKIGCYQIVKLFKTGKYDINTDLATHLPDKFNRLFKTGPVET